MIKGIYKFTIVPRTSHFPEMKPGEAYWSLLSENRADPPKRVLWMCCPGCEEMQLISEHNIIENPDGTVTITPSLQCPNCPAHFHVTNGEIV